MALFLSQEWFEDVRSHTPADRAEASGAASILIEQTVTGAPDGEVTYCVEITGSAARLVWPAPSPRSSDLRFTCQWETAVEIAKGELSTQRALMQGRLRVSGSPARLVTTARGLGSADPVPATVRARTTYTKTRSITT